MTNKHHKQEPVHLKPTINSNAVISKQEVKPVQNIVPVHNDDGFFLIFACMAAFAVYHFGLRPLLVTGINTKTISTTAKSFFAAIQSFILSKWTWILGVLIAAIIATYIFNHLWFTVAFVALLFVALDKLFYTVPNTSTLVGEVEAAAQKELDTVVASLKGSLAKAVAPIVSDLQVQLAAKEAEVSKLVSASAAAAAMLPTADAAAKALVNEVKATV